VYGEEIGTVLTEERITKVAGELFSRLGRNFRVEYFRITYRAVGDEFFHVEFISYFYEMNDRIYEIFYWKLLFDRNFCKEFGWSLLNYINRLRLRGIGGDYIFIDLKISEPKIPSWDKDSGFTFVLKSVSGIGDISCLSIYKQSGYIRFQSSYIDKKDLTSMVAQSLRDSIISELISESV